MRHMGTFDRPICTIGATAETIREATRMIYADVECQECFRQAIAEAEERAGVLRELLAKIEQQATEDKIP